MQRSAWGNNEHEPKSQGSRWQWWFMGAVALGLATIAVAPPSVLGQPDLAQPDLAPPAIPTPPPEEQAGVETLTQGPIHEAFANPADLDPTPGPVVAKQPPADIPEEAPEFMPEDSVWIPGYWIWDDERNDFVWVTGVARKIPPGMRYVPGYWIEVDGGFQRVSGFWANADTDELEYREPPPETLEAGPSSPAPAENYFWVPGNWNYYDTGYRWRAGYWSPYQPDWVWCPARWVWTPAGCIYLPGYWDYRLSYRGTMFAPAYFTTPVYTQPNWVYRPWCTIPTSNLFIHLWIRPNYCHYYFGNYYGPRYASFGFNSWCNYPTRRYHYDPFLTYCNVHYRRQGIDFVGRVRGWHDHYDRHEDRRPPRTWREQQTFVAQRDNRASLQTQLLASNVVDVAKRTDAPIKLARVDNQKRQAVAERSERIRELNAARKQVERDASKVAVQLPRDNDDRTPNRGKAGDRDNLPGKAKSNDQPAPGKTAGRDARGDKAGPGDRGDKSDRGDKGDKSGSLLDRAEEGTKTGTEGGPKGGAGDRSPAGGPGSAKGRGGPKLTLPKDPIAPAREGTRPGAGTGSKSGGVRRDNIPPPMPQGTGESRPSREPGDRPVSPGGPGGKAKGGRDDRPGSDIPDRGNKSDAPRPRLPGMDLPGDASGGSRPKGMGPKADVPPRSDPPGKLPKADVPRINPPGDRPSGNFPKSAPKVDAPSPSPPNRPKGGGPKADAPRIEPPRPNRPTFEAPKVDRPRPENRPQVEAKRIETPNIERPRVQPRVESPQPQPRIEAPRPKPQPRIDPPRASAPRPEPRVEAPRPAPRVEVPRPSPRAEAPRIEAPRPAPRVEAPRNQPPPRIDAPRNVSPRVVSPPRVETPRPNAPPGNAGSSENRGRGKGRNKD